MTQPDAETPGRTRSIPVASEPARRSACYAPHSSMYLDQFGKVRACCQNTGVYLGDITEQPLRAIWESAEAERIRVALEHDDLSAGCDFCAWQLREGNDEIVFARQFDHLRPSESRPRWPKQLELSLTNTCNLACTMCNGDWSSTIRSKREGRPPIGPVYGDEFFDRLTEFLPHLERVEFLGGEPFLGVEPLRVMEMLAEMPTPPSVTITTNGTLFTKRVERIVRALLPDIVVSVDGATAATYDAIRVGAHLPAVLANIDRFVAELGPGRVSLAHCLMTSNWHEFADLLRLAEDRGLHVGVNVVRLPAAQSLYHLDEQELVHVVSTLRSTDVSFLTGRRLEMWEGHVAALANRLAAGSGQRPGVRPEVPGSSAVTTIHPSSDGQPAPAVSRWAWLPFPEHDPDDADPPSDRPTEDPIVLEVHTDGVLQVIRHDTDAPIDLRHLHGTRFERLNAWLVKHYGDESTWEIPSRVHGVDDNRFSIGLGATGVAPRARVRAAALRTPTGALRGVRLVVDFPTVSRAALAAPGRDQVPGAPTATAGA